MQQKLLRNLSKVLATKKRHYMGDLPSRTKIEKIKKKELFVTMVSKFGVSKSTIVFKMALVKLINSYPKIKNSSLF